MVIIMVMIMVMKIVMIVVMNYFHGGTKYIKTTVHTDNCLLRSGIKFLFINYISDVTRQPEAIYQRSFHLTHSQFPSHCHLIFIKSYLIYNSYVCC